jgi:hypothetical protein
MYDSFQFASFSCIARLHIMHLDMANLYTLYPDALVRSFLSGSLICWNSKPKLLLNQAVCWQQASRSAVEL